MKEIILHLQSIGKRVFILTNGSSIDQRIKLNRLGINDLIDEEDWFISDDFSISKPEKELFDQIANILDLPNEDILYIGDNITNDIYGSLHAGWQAIFFNYRSHATDEEMLTVQTEEELYKLLLKLYPKA